GIDKVKTPAFTVSLQKSPAAVQISDSTMIPAEFTIVKYDLDKKRIGEALKAGQEIPGAMLTQGRHLRIR
ncbi:MAG: siphovirus Gp157 family protein, partial [Bacillota bacterium]